MLVLSRKTNERIFISTADAMIQVCLVEIRGDKVRLGVQAPRHVEVHREEVWEAIQKSGLNKFQKSGPKVHRAEIED